MELKPLAELTRKLVILLKITFVLTALAVLINSNDYIKYLNAPPVLDSNESFTTADGLIAVFGLTYVIILSIMSAAFLFWVHRASTNLAVLSNEEMKFTPSWAVGWFFIPFLNLVKPREVMIELWQGSHMDKETNPLVVNIWWGLFVLSTMIGRTAIKVFIDAGATSGFAISSLAHGIADVFDVFTTIYAIRVVTQIGLAYSKNFGNLAAKKVSM